MTEKEKDCVNRWEKCLTEFDNSIRKIDINKFYVARDKNGTLAMFVEKPTRIIKDDHGENYWKVTGFGHGMWMYLYNDMFPELKWEDEPKLVSIEEII